MNAPAQRSGAPGLDCELVADLPSGPRRLALRLAAGATLQDALDAARRLWGDCDVDWAHAEVGVWGVRSARQQSLQPGDRVEVYRGLLQDPRQARRERFRRRAR